MSTTGTGRRGSGAASSSWWPESVHMQEHGVAAVEQNLGAASDDTGAAPAAGAGPCLPLANGAGPRGAAWDSAVDPPPGDAILKAVEQEVTQYLNEGCPGIRQGGKRWRCALCPWRSFRGKPRLVNHVRKQHVKRTQWVAAGTKSMKVVIAMFDDANFRLSADVAPGPLARPTYLRRAAERMRQWITPAVRGTLTNIDSEIRLLLDTSGPRYVGLTSVWDAEYRRVGNMYITHDFAEAVFRHAMLCAGSLRGLAAAMTFDVVRAGSDMASLLPQRRNAWAALMEDVFVGPAPEKMIATLVDQCADKEEFVCLSLDCTVKIMQKIKGQSHFMEKREVRQSHPIPDEEAMRALLTVRGRSGAVLLLRPLRQESSELICTALRDGLSPRVREQVRYVCVDDASSKLLRLLHEVLPNLEILSVDPVHLAMRYEDSQGRHRTPGSRMLRRLLHKFSRTPASDASLSLAVFDGDHAPGRTAQEASAAGMIADGSMPLARARRVLNDCDHMVPWRSRSEWVHVLAALTACYWDECKKTTAGKRMASVLAIAAEPHRCEWLLNNTRFRARLPPAWLELLPVGSTSNEALHAEMNNWFRRTTEHYVSTVHVKLVVFHCVKLLTHNRAMYTPCTHQLEQSVVLARELGFRRLWSPTAWATRCLEQRARRRCRSKTDPRTLEHSGPHARRVVGRAALRQAIEKRGLADRVHRWKLVQKKPSGKRPILHRTPFMQNLATRLRSAGRRGAREGDAA